MSDIATILVTTYVMIAVVLFIGGVVTFVVAVPAEREKRRKSARLILSAPVFLPVVLVVAIVATAKFFIQVVREAELIRR